MFSIKLANHIFTVQNQYSYVERLCHGYLCDKPGIPITVTEEEIEREQTADIQFSKEYLESLAVYRKICEYLLHDDILLFHASAVMLDGKAYLFTAPSGTGKSTHARLWREKFGNRLAVINDDKPLLSITKDCITVYGTPYAGKEHLQTNTCARVNAIVFLHQAPENTVCRLNAHEAYPKLLNQAYRPADSTGMIKTMDLIKCLSQLPLYSLHCTISQEAVDLLYSQLKEL